MEVAADRDLAIECSILIDMFTQKFSPEFLMQLLKNCSFDVVFECLLEFVELNQGFEFEDEVITPGGDEFSQENVFQGKPAEEVLSDELVLALYFEFKEENFCSNGDNATALKLLYEFLDKIQSDHFLSLMDRQTNLKSGLNLGS